MKRDMADKGESLESKTQLLLESQAEDGLYEIIAQSAHTVRGGCSGRNTTA